MPEPTQTTMFGDTAPVAPPSAPVTHAPAAPLFTAPATMAGQLALPGALGVKMTLRARDVRAGDFTLFSGYRRVIIAKPTTRKRVRFTRADGSTDAIDRDREITVYRHD